MFAFLGNSAQITLVANPAAEADVSPTISSSACALAQPATIERLSRVVVHGGARWCEEPCRVRMTCRNPHVAPTHYTSHR